MIDWLWWLDAPFWQKLYAIGNIAGITYFISEMFKLLDGWNIKLKKFINDCHQNYINDLKKWRH
jgi:hypothetical protein